VKAPNPGYHDFFGISLAICGAGRTLAVGAFSEDSAARGIDGNQSSDSAPDSGAVYLY
jgi:trimeric autotransporter adhesin